MVVAIVESNWTGHFPSYFKQFCHVLLNLHCDVLAVCPDPQEVVAWLRDRGHPEESLRTRFHSTRFTAPAIPLRPLLFREYVNRALYFPLLRKALSRLERACGFSSNLVFFASVHENRFCQFPPRSGAFPWPWSGLYVQCRLFNRGNFGEAHRRKLAQFSKVLRDPRLTALAMLEEDSIAPMHRAFPETPVVIFPDFVDDAAPPEHGPHLSLREFAAGRPVIGLLGHLQPSKGVISFSHAALHPANANVVFALVGDIIWSMFTSKDRLLLEEVRHAPNVWTHYSRLASEAEFNGMIQSCDLVHAAYHDFPHSSNLLGKAALFNKPVIVSEGRLMAERVRRHHLGKVIPQGSLEDLIHAIHELLPPGRSNLMDQKYDGAGYLQVHSADALEACFRWILDLHASRSAAPPTTFHML